MKLYYGLNRLRLRSYRQYTCSFYPPIPPGVVRNLKALRSPGFAETYLCKCSLFAKQGPYLAKLRRNRTNHRLHDSHRSHCPRRDPYNLVSVAPH